MDLKYGFVDKPPGFTVGCSTKTKPFFSPRSSRPLVKSTAILGKIRLVKLWIVYHLTYCGSSKCNDTSRDGLSPIFACNRDAEQEGATPSRVIINQLDKGL